MAEKFWWETYSKSNSDIPSLDTGVINCRRGVKTESIFASKNFKDISPMLEQDEIAIAALKAVGKSNTEIAERLGMSLKDVSDKVRLMILMYKNVFGLQEKEPSYRTIKSKTGR